MGLFSPSLPPGETFGVLARFPTPAALFHACEGVRDAGYTRWDAHSPFPVHGLDGAMGLGRSRLPYLVLAVALCGAMGGFYLQVWANGIAYPLEISGKPAFNWQPYIPVTFELGVLSAALTTVVGMLAFNQLPMHYHPLFSSRVFESVTDDGFFISIESWDPKYDTTAVEAFLRGLGADHVEVVRRHEEPAGGGRYAVSQAGPAHHSLEDLAREDGKALSMLTWIGAGAGVVGLVGSIALSSAHPARFYFSWLTAYLYFLSIALGSLFFVLALFVCRAGWSVAFRRLLENTMATLPVFAVLFLPIWFGRHELYEWTHAEEVAKSHLLKGKSGYLNEGFFAIRSVFYLLSWSAIATYFSTQSQRQDGSGDEAITRRLQSIAAPSLIVFSLTISFAAIDWIMSLEPEWYSTIYGVYYFAGSVLGGFAFLILGIAFLHARGRLQGVVTVEHVHDVGKLLFGFTVFWTYIGFSQYFLIWYANMPEETAYYMHRSHGSWPSIAKLLIGGHFVLPFFFLMPRAIKRSSALLALAATWLLAMHYVDMYWCVMPPHLPKGPGFSILDGTAMVGVGGFFLAALGWVASRRALVPLRDPRLAESLSFENV